MKNRIAMGLVSILLASPLFAATKIDVTVNGMVCSFCAQGITKKFMARPEVAKVEVKLSDQKVYLQLKDGQSLGDEEVRKILKESGYSVEKVERPTS